MKRKTVSGYTLAFCIAIASQAQAATPTATELRTPQNQNDSTTNEVLKSYTRPPSQLFDEREKKQPAIQVEKEQAPSPAAASEAQVVFLTFVLQGSTVLRKEDVEPVIKPFIGEKMTVTQLQRLAALLTRIYQQKGFTASYCQLPAQQVTDGKVVFQCVEPKIGRLIIKNAEEYNEKLFLSFIKPLRDKPLNVNDLNERLKSLSLMPTFIANVALKRTERPDIIDLEIDLKEKPLNSAEIYLDNYGSRFSGRERIGGIYNVINPSGYGDVLSLQARTSMDTSLNHFASIGYKKLLNSRGGILTLVASYNDYEVTPEATSSNLRMDGDSTSLTVNYKHPLMIGKSAIITGNLQYDYKDIKSTTSVTGSVPFTLFDKRDKTHVFSIGLDVESLDRANGWNNFSFSLLRGVEGFFNGMRTRDTTWSTDSLDAGPIKSTIRENVVPAFTLLTANYYRRQLFQVGQYGIENIFGLYGQYTWDRVPSAYTFADGDYGFHSSVEFRFPVWDDALKLSTAYNYEMYCNTPRSRRIVGLFKEDSHSVTGGVLGYVKCIKADYYLAYTKGISSKDKSWDDYRHTDKVTFNFSKKF